MAPDRKPVASDGHERGDKMKRHRTAKQHKMNNSGSAMVTVLVVIVFMSILATVMLYLSGANFQMKVTDFRTKESFYQAETPVEELRAQLVKDVEIAFAKAYTATVSEYSGMGDAATRESNFRQHFCDEMNTIWENRCGVIVPDPSNPAYRVYDWETGIGNVVESVGADAFLDFEVTPSLGFDTSEPGLIVLRGVKVIYDSPQFYTSIISTDLCITIPKINWSGTFEPAVPAATPVPGASPAPTSAPAEYYFDGNFNSCVNYMNWMKQ